MLDSGTRSAPRQAGLLNPLPPSSTARVSSPRTSAARMASTGEKKVNGRKRHILVDVLGMVLMVLVTPANVQDRDAAAVIVREAHREFAALQLIWVDGAYNGDAIDKVATDTGINIQMVKRTDDAKEFKVLPRRWVVERTFGWFGKYRLLSKEYERTIESSTADVLHAMTMLMLRRLTTPHESRKEAR
jgi:putative transposase